MANSTSTVATGKKKTAKAKDTFVAAQDIPLERRTDVTVDELETLPLPHPAELYDGKVVYKMPTFAHSVIQNNIGAEIRIYFKKNPIGIAGGDGNYRLWPERKRESRAPDVSVVLKKSLPKGWNRYLPIAPDIAIEILSPNDSFEKMMKKVDEYLTAGVKLVWVVIVSTREVMVCSKESKYIVNDKLTAPELLPNFELPIETIFDELEE